MVPCKIFAHSGAGPFNTETAIPVKTRDTPEWGRRVRPKKRLPVVGDFVMLAPEYAPKYFQIAGARIYTAVKSPVPKIKW